MATQQVNSRGWWDDYFDNQWSKNNGQSQTRGFMATLITHLPDPEVAYLREHSLSILDWGCAMGDGVAQLGKAFPSAAVAGLDFSEHAIRAARDAYPEHTFIHTPAGEIPRHFDVIVTSNCLEHFERPLDIMRMHLASCDKLYVAMVPYNEPLPLLDQHMHQFQVDSFPKEVDGFVRLFGEPVDVPSVYWAGQQLLVVYGSAEYLKQRPSALITEQLLDIQRMRTQILGEETQHIAKLAYRMFNQSGEHWHARVTQAEQLLNDTILQRDHLGAQLVDANSQLAEANQQLSTTQWTLSATQLKVGELQQNLAQLGANLNFVYSTKAWRASTTFWRARDKGVAAPFWLALQLTKYVARIGYHLTVPYPIRLRIWTRRHSVGERTTAIPPHVAQVTSLEADRRAEAEIKQLLVEHKNAKGVVVLPPSIPWDVPLFQRPQQLAIALAKLGYLVLYWESDAPAVARIDKLRDNLYVLHVPPSALKQVQRPIAFSYTYNYQKVMQLTDPIVVYEFIDHLDIFTDYPRLFLEANHQQLLTEAAVCVGTADDLVSEMRVVRPDAVLSPNGVDYDFFAGVADAAPAPIPDDMRNIVAQGKPIIGYYGALAEWFDYDLIHYLAAKFPHWNFVLIGPPYDSSLMSSAIGLHPNVYLMGKRSYHDLPGYLRTFSVATIPFKVSDAIHAVSPLKLFEYMAGGKPIVTSDMTECQKYPEVQIARSPEEWAEKLQAAISLSRDADYIERVRLRALENTWQLRAQTILSAVDEHERANVVDKATA